LIYGIIILKRGAQMAVTYKNLRKLLIDRDMTKTQLRQKTGIGTTTLAKLSSNDYVSLEVVDKICTALEVQPNDIMEIIPNTDKK